MDSVLSKYMPDSTSTPAKNTGKEIIPQKLEIINLLAYPKNLCTFATSNEQK